MMNPAQHRSVVPLCQSPDWQCEPLKAYLDDFEFVDVHPGSPALACLRMLRVADQTLPGRGAHDISSVI
jgi:hypothetical protein